MDIKKLKYFLAVVEEGGYSAAARKLYISQPNLSKAVKALEEEVGFAFFEPGTGKIKLTNKGNNFLSLSKHIVEEFDNFCSSIETKVNKISGHISIGIPPIIGTCILPPILEHFHERYPEITIEITQRPANTIQRLINEGSIDLGFVIMPVLPNLFEVTHIVSDTNTLIVSLKHPLALEKSISYDKLRNEKFVLLDNEFILNTSVLSACHEFGYEPSVIIEASNWDFIVQLVKNNMGISIIPRRIFDLYPEKDIVKIEIDHPSKKWDVVMIVKKGRYKSTPVHKFISLTKEMININHS